MTAPLSRLTVLFQVNNIKVGGIGFKDLWLVSKDIYFKDGVQSFWKGNLTQIAHRFPYSAINFSVYATLKDKSNKCKNHRKFQILT